MYDFIKLPNTMFYPVGDDKSLLQLIADDKVLLIIDYLYFNTNRLEIVKFTLEDMILSCGYKLNPRAKKCNSQFIDILTKLQDVKIFNLIEPESLNNIKSNKIVKGSIDLIKKKKNKKGEDSEEGFIMLMSFERDRILNQEFEKVDNLKLLIYYCYLKCRMYKLPDGGILQKDGGKAEVCYPSYDLINKELGFTDESIKKYNDLLVKLDLIRIANPGLWYYVSDPNKIPRESSNIYTLWTVEELLWKLNLKEGIKQWKDLEINENKVFIGNQVYKNNDRRLNGELSSIKKKIKNNKATEKDLARKIELEEFIGENTEQKFRIQALLDTHKTKNDEDMLLSEIYSECGKEDKADKYYDIEVKLGLIDDDSELLIDWENYKHVMMNYTEAEHGYYVNCVAKEIRESNVNKTNGIIETKGSGLTKNGNKIEDVKKVNRSNSCSLFDGTKLLTLIEYSDKSHSLPEEVQDKFWGEFEGDLTKLSVEEDKEVRMKMNKFFMDYEADVSLKF